MRVVLERLLAAFFFLFNGFAVAEMKDRKETTCVIIHYSATIGGNVKAFRRCHKEEKGYEDIGYHFVITNGSGGPDGEIQKGRILEKEGAHAKSRNSNSVGICLVGTNEFTQKQKDSLVSLLVDLCRIYKIKPTEETIQRHHENYPGPGCPGPGLDLLEIIERVKKKMEANSNRAVSPRKRPFHFNLHLRSENFTGLLFSF